MPAKLNFLSAITPAFIVTWSFRNHSNILICCSRNILCCFSRGNHIMDTEGVQDICVGWCWGTLPWVWLQQWWCGILGWIQYGVAWSYCGSWCSCCSWRPRGGVSQICMLHNLLTFHIVEQQSKVLCDWKKMYSLTAPCKGKKTFWLCRYGWLSWPELNWVPCVYSSVWSGPHGCKYKMKLQ